MCQNSTALCVWPAPCALKELVGQVRGGEKGTLVVYANTYKKTTKGEKGEEVEAAIPFMKGYTVFNVEQIDQLPAHYHAQAMPVHDTPPVMRKRRLISCEGCRLRPEGTGRRFYLHACQILSG